jgi:hypothetical protein
MRQCSSSDPMKVSGTARTYSPSRVAIRLRMSSVCPVSAKISSISVPVTNSSTVVRAFS